MNEKPKVIFTPFIKFIVILSVFIIIAFLVSIQKNNSVKSDNTNVSNNSINENKTQKENKNTQIESKKTPSIQTITGKGDDVKKIELNEGLAIFKSEYSGKRNFIVHLNDSDGETIEYIVSTIDQYTGSKSVKIKKSGNYLLEVSSSGNWKIEIEN